MAITFSYDNLDRLKTVTGPQNLSMDYDSKGNITEKSDVGDVFGYTHPTKPYALTDLETASGLVPVELQVATYTSFEQVSTIDEGDYHATFTYNADDQRAKMLVTDLGSPVLTRWYVGSRYIKETEGAVTKEFTWVGGDAYSAPAVAVKQGANTTWYYLLRDYLGNITHVVNTSNTVTAEYSYDAWGRRRDPDDWGSYDVSGEPALFAGRGFTGHEWLPWFNLYNMNGRLYDPVVGRFLSADNYVQMPGFTQSFNRYSYCLNNPLKYTDPDGEFFLGTIITFVSDLVKTAFFKGGLDPTSSNARQNAWREFDPTAPWSKTNKAFKIDMGGFATDPNRTIVGQGIQLLSRWTWELPQTATGKLFSHTRNFFGGVDNVDYYGGATLVNKNDNSRERWGLTLGPYINSKNLVADPYTDDVFRHEYGHTLQSRLVGPLYLTSVGLPSLVGAFLDYNVGINDHDREWYETQANRMAERYFSNHDPGALATLNWDNNSYPRKYSPTWYWIFSHPHLPFAWWLFF